MIKIVGLTKEIASEKTIYFAQTYAVKLMFSLIWLLSVKATTSADISSSDNMLSLTTINGSKMSPIVMEQTSSGNATLSFNGRMHHKIDVLNLPNNRLLGDHSSYYFVNTGANKGGANFITLPTASSDGLFYNVRLTPGSEGLLYITSTSNINNEHGVVLDPSDSTNPNVSLMGVAGNWLTLDKNSVFPWQNVSNGNEIDGNYAYIDTGSASTASNVIYLPDSPKVDEVYRLTLSPQSAANLYVVSQNQGINAQHSQHQGVLLNPKRGENGVSLQYGSGNWHVLDVGIDGVNAVENEDTVREGYQFIDTGNAGANILYLPPAIDVAGNTIKIGTTKENLADIYVFSEVFDDFYKLNNAEYQNGVVVEPDQSRSSELTFTAVSGNWVFSGNKGGLTSSANIVDAQREGLVSDNLIGWWKLNEIGSGNVAENLVLSGNKGIVEGNVQMENDADRGQVYDFTNDGDSKSVVKVEMKTGDFTTMKEFSVSMWIKMKEHHVNQQYIFAIANVGKANAYAFMRVDDSKLFFRVAKSGTGYYQNQWNIDVSQHWHYVCASCNISGLALYVDDRKQFKQSSGDYSNNKKDTFYIGNADSNGNATNSANTFIQDVQVYNRFLSDEEVNKLYESGRIPRD